VTAESVCVFAGSMPDAFIPDCRRLVETCRKPGAVIVVDTYGPALKALVEAGDLWVMKPNLQELRELLGRDVADDSGEIVKAGRQIRGKVGTVLVSRGANGAVLITKDAAWRAAVHDAGRNALRTVGCGDYLLGGFLDGILADLTADNALARGVITATARAWGLTEHKTFAEVADSIIVDVARID